MPDYTVPVINNRGGGVMLAVDQSISIKVQKTLRLLLPAAGSSNAALSQVMPCI